MLSLLTLMGFSSVIQQTLSSNFSSVISSWFVPDDSVLCSSRHKYISHHFYSLQSEFLLAHPLDYSKHLCRLLAQPADLWPDHLFDHLITCVITCLHNDQTIAGKCGRSEQKKRKQTNLHKGYEQNHTCTPVASVRRKVSRWMWSQIHLGKAHASS